MCLCQENNPCVKRAERSKMQNICLNISGPLHLSDLLLLVCPVKLDLSSTVFIPKSLFKQTNIKCLSDLREAETITQESSPTKSTWCIFMMVICHFKCQHFLKYVCLQGSGAFRWKNLNLDFFLPRQRALTFQQPERFRLHNLSRLCQPTIYNPYARPFA